MTLAARRFSPLTVVVLLAGFWGACDSADREASPTGRTEGVDEAAAQETPSGTLDCSAFPEGLALQVAMGYTQVKQLTPENLSLMREALGLLDPSSFRIFADAFEQHHPDIPWLGLGNEKVRSTTRRYGSSTH